MLTWSRHIALAHSHCIHSHRSSRVTHPEGATPCWEAGCYYSALAALNLSSLPGRERDRSDNMDVPQGCLGAVWHTQRLPPAPAGVWGWLPPLEGTSNPRTSCRAHLVPAPGEAKRRQDPESGAALTRSRDEMGSAPLTSPQDASLSPSKSLSAPPATSAVKERCEHTAGQGGLCVCYTGEQSH